jgi:hypothetical protein
LANRKLSEKPVSRDLLASASRPIQEGSAEYLEKSPVLAKVNLVAGEDTICALARFGEEFSGTFFRLAQQRMVLSILQEPIAMKVALVKGFGKTRDAMIEASPAP